MFQNIQTNEDGSQKRNNFKNFNMSPLYVREKFSRTWHFRGVLNGKVDKKESY